MASVHNLHGSTLWGFFLAHSPILSAEVTGLFVDRSRHVFHSCQVSIEALSHYRNQGQREEKPYAHPRAVSGGDRTLRAIH
jgi:hypothetical protein